MNDQSNADRDDQKDFLALIAMSIEDYKNIRKEISDLDYTLAGVFNSLKENSGNNPAYKNPELLNAVFKKTQEADLILGVRSESSDQSKPVNPVPPFVALYADKHSEKPLDTLYNSIWYNSRMFNSPASYRTEIERVAFEELLELMPADFPEIRGQYLAIVDGNIIPNRTVQQQLDYNQALHIRQSLTLFANLLSLFSIQYASYADSPAISLKFYQSILRLIVEGYAFFKMTDQYLITNGMNVGLSGSPLAYLGFGLTLIHGLEMAYQFHARKDGQGALEDWRDNLRIAFSGVQIIRSLHLADQGMGVFLAVPGSEVAILNGVAGLANLGAEILDIVHAGYNEGASTGYLAAAGTGLALQLISGLLVAFVPTVSGLAASMLISGFNPKSIYQSIQFGEVADQLEAKYHETGWLGDKALAGLFLNKQSEAMIAAMPLVSYFSGFVHSGTNNSESAKTQLIRAYSEKLGTSDLASIVQSFWTDGLDSRERAVQQNYATTLRDIASKTDSQRVIVVTGQELRQDMAMVAAFLGGSFSNGVNSNRNYFYDSRKLTPGENGMIGTGLNSDRIDIGSDAQKQYFLFLTPVMAVSDSERYVSSSGKTTTYGTRLPSIAPLLTVTDDASASIADLRNFASSAPHAPIADELRGMVVGVAGGMSAEMGAGDDVVIAGARAMFVDGGKDIDGLDYRYALTSYISEKPAVTVTPFAEASGASGYKVRKIGSGTFHDVTLTETAIQEGKATRIVITRSTTTTYNVYSNSQQDVLVNVEWIHGTRHVDSMTGSDKADIFVGYGGNDSLHGKDGDDQLSGGDGADQLDGGTGYDLLMGNAGNDLLTVSSQDTGPVAAGPARRVAQALVGDTLIGGEGNDTIRAGAGNDLMFGDDPEDKEQAAITTAAPPLNNNDILYGGAGDDTIDGGSGNDTADGGEGDDQIFGGSGADSLSGASGNDTIWGGDGNDSIYGNEGEDALYGMDGDDRLQAGNQASILIGGAGRDKLFGGLGHDVLSGGQGSDTLRGGGGNDILFDDGRDKNIPNELYGEDGDDILVVTDAGLYDILDGGPGRDIVSFRYLTTGVVVNLETKSVDRRGANSPSKDSIRSIEWVEGSEHDDVLTGSSTDSRLIGRGGNDTLYGGGGRDILFGGEGRDELYGGAGADIIDGGAGDDYIYARGGDTMFFDGDFGHDIVQAEAEGDLSSSLLIFTGIDYRNLYFARQEDHLLIRRERYIAGVDRSDYMGRSGVLIMDYFTGRNSDKVAFADQNGSALVGVAMIVLVAAMVHASEVSSTVQDYTNYMKPVWEEAWLSQAIEA